MQKHVLMAGVRMRVLGRRVVWTVVCDCAYLWLKTVVCPQHCYFLHAQCHVHCTQA